MTVSIVIVTWNGASVLSACLGSVAAQQGIEIGRVIVVDNASSDGTVELLDSLRPALPFELVVVANDENRGYGAANNQGASRASGEFLVLLNPDTAFVRADSLARLCGSLHDAGVGLVGPRLINPDGTLQPSCAAIPSVSHALILGTGLHRLVPRSLQARFAPRRWAHDITTEVGWVGGACMALRLRDFRSIGGFSEATFMYGEDLELAYCIRQRGYFVVFVSDSVVIHHDDHSADQRWSSAQRAARVARGNLVFLQRHYGPVRRNTIRSILAGTYLVRWLLYILLGDERATVCRAMALQYSQERGASRQSDS